MQYLIVNDLLTPDEIMRQFARNDRLEKIKIVEATQQLFMKKIIQEWIFSTDFLFLQFYLMHTSV